MEHLTLETMARLVDEAPDAAERDHLARCPGCRIELDGMVRQTRELSGLSAPGASDADLGWGGVEAALRAEGILREVEIPSESGSSRTAGVVPFATAPAISSPRDPASGRTGAFAIGRAAARNSFAFPSWMRIAASLLLFALGGTVGWGMRGGVEAATENVSGGAEIALVEEGSGEPSLPPMEEVLEELDDASSSMTDPTTGAAVSPALPVSPAAAPSSSPSVIDFANAPPEVILALLSSLPREAASVEEAEAVVQVAGAFYSDALGIYRDFLERSGRAPVPDPVGRYMALGNILAITEDAIRSAPTDPFLNGLLVNTLVERDAAQRGMMVAQATGSVEAP